MNTDVDEVVRIMRDDLIRWCERRVSETHRHFSPEDVAQEVWIRVTRAWPSFVGGTHTTSVLVRAWVFRIAHNVLFDMNEHFNRIRWSQIDGPRVSDRNETILFLQSSPASVEDMVLERVDASRLVSIVQGAVSDDEWRMFCEFVESDCDHSVVAQRHALAYRAYQARIHRIRVKMRGALARLAESDATPYSRQCQHHGKGGKNVGLA